MKQRLLLFITTLMLCMGARATIFQVIDGLKYIRDARKSVKNNLTI